MDTFVDLGRLSGGSLDTLVQSSDTLFAHTMTQDGEYVIRLVVKDSECGIDATEQSFDVELPPPPPPLTASILGE